MPDNWGYVLAAYVVAAALVGAYWRYLARRARQLDVHRVRLRRPTPGRSHPRPESPSKASP
jgi:hypothetical protein